MQCSVNGVKFGKNKLINFYNDSSKNQSVMSFFVAAVSVGSLCIFSRLSVVVVTILCLPCYFNLNTHTHTQTPPGNSNSNNGKETRLVFLAQR
jgi:hypothetical protein